MRKRLFVLLLASVLSLASCNKKSEKNEEPKYEGVVSSVTLSQRDIEIFAGKRSGDITVTVNGEGSFNRTVKVTSENADIAYTSFTEVDSGHAFKVYGKALGQTRINVASKQDETKVASINVNVIEKQEVVVSEVQSVSVDQETKLFKLSDDPIDVTVTVNGLGNYDNTVNLTLTGDPCVTLDKTSLASGEKFRITPAQVSTSLFLRFLRRRNHCR